ncbi:MAG: YfcE family phosphodiesterase [Clostridiales bacterium]|nr:YfcE family phosphodiesterase [Clostridiales bacterium]
MKYRLIVLSDVHYDIDRVRSIMPIINSSDYLVFCGDGLNGLLSIRGEITVPTVCVRGNNDWNTVVDDVATFTVGDTRALVTHGHRQDVRRGISGLIELATLNNCKLVFFGHTHSPYDAVNNGIHIINPGAVCNGTYALVTGDGQTFASKLCFV